MCDLPVFLPHHWLGRNKLWATLHIVIKLLDTPAILRYDWSIEARCCVLVALARSSLTTVTCMTMQNMEMLSVSNDFCKGKDPLSSPTPSPPLKHTDTQSVKQSFHVSCLVNLEKLLNKMSSCLWYKKPYGSWGNCVFPCILLINICQAYLMWLRPQWIWVNQPIANDN